jgi:hypothetical protein
MAGKRKGKKRVHPACKAKRAAIGKAGTRHAKGKALAAYSACQREHGIKPRRHKRRK